MSRSVALIVSAMALAGLCWFFPLFHLVPLERAAKEQSAAAFNPAEFAEQFWNERLLKSLAQAAPADALLPAIKTNAAAAKKQFGRTIGVSESYTYFVSGRGRVLAASDDEIAVAVTPGAMNAEVVLLGGLLFGNAVRDGTGLLNVSDYPNSQDYNALSEALNRLVETRVQPQLRANAKVGALIRFVGCAEVNDESSDLNPLRVVPVLAEVASQP